MPTTATSIRSPKEQLEANVCEAHSILVEALPRWSNPAFLPEHPGARQRRLQALRSLLNQCEQVINGNADADATFGRSGLSPLGQALWASSCTTRY